MTARVDAATTTLGTAVAASLSLTTTDSKTITLVSAITEMVAAKIEEKTQEQIVATVDYATPAPPKVVT